MYARGLPLSDVMDTVEIKTLLEIYPELKVAFALGYVRGVMFAPSLSITFNSEGSRYLKLFDESLVNIETLTVTFS